jgi:glycosyltransferase involved in cell wall biosynthesis
LNDLKNIQFRGRIVYLGPVPFPNGGAAARRILGNALTLTQSGYEVLIGSGQLPKKNSMQPEKYHGLTVYSIGERIAEDKPVLIKHLIYSRMGKKSIEWLNDLDPKPIAIILYGGYTPYLIRLIPWCRKYAVPLVFEAVEWYDPGNMPGGRYSPYRINIELTMQYYAPRVKNIIAISSYLENYFRNLNCETICIPPTLDTAQFTSPLKVRTNKLITIGYAGTPGNKDLFNNYLEALYRIDPKGERFRLNIAGLTNSEILNYPAMKKRNITEMPLMINSIGKVSHNEAVQLIGSSDFSVLQRSNKRYAVAGFPTKVVESMSMGTPVICNLTSDLYKYVHDGISGVVCEDSSVDSLTSALSRIKDFSSQTLDQMSSACRKIAEEHFDYHVYISEFDQFIQRLKLIK